MQFMQDFLPIYSEPLYRPPSESSSLIFQITEGCSHNKCTFCGMYVNKKFRLKPVDEVKAEIDAIPKKYAQNVKKIFLADGDAVIYPTKGLIEILDHMNLKFPSLERVSSYAGSQEFIQKSVDDWKEFKKRKLNLLYFGMESGNNDVLRLMNKGHDVEEFKESVIAAARVIDLSVMIILGGGGRKYSEVHALETASLISEINPKYASLLTLFMRRGKDYFANIETPTIGDLMREARMIISHIEGGDIIFRSNHISNFVSLSGVLPGDRSLLVEELDKGMDKLKRNNMLENYPDYYMEDC